MEKEYRVLSFSEGRELGIYELYSCLVGPDEFECTLTEIEDRTWGRDLRPVVNRLKEQHARIAELEAQLAAAQERNVALQSEHLNHVNALHEQLTAMTAERDSESRWAKHYSDKVTELEQQLAAMQRIIDSYR